MDHQWHNFTPTDNNGLKSTVFTSAGATADQTLKIANEFIQEKEIGEVTMSTFKRQRLTFTIDQITEQFEKPIANAAKSLGISVTRLKQICRTFGFTQWPFRKLTHLKKKIVKLEKKREEAVRMNWSKDALMRLDQMIHVEYDEIGRLITPSKNSKQQLQSPEEEANSQHKAVTSLFGSLLKSNKRKKPSKESAEDIPVKRESNSKKLNSPSSHGEWLGSPSSPSLPSTKKRVKRLKVSDSRKDSQDVVTKYSDSSNSEKEDDEIQSNLAAGNTSNPLVQERKKGNGKSSLNLFHFFKASNKVAEMQQCAPQINISVPQPQLQQQQQQQQQQKGSHLLKDGLDFSLQNLNRFFGTASNSFIQVVAPKKSNNQTQDANQMSTSPNQQEIVMKKKGIFSFFGLSGKDKEKNMDLMKMMSVNPQKYKLNSDDVSQSTQSTELPSFSELLASIQDWSENIDCDPTEESEDCAGFEQELMLSLQENSESSEFVESCLSGGGSSFTTSSTVTFTPNSNEIEKTKSSFMNYNNRGMNNSLYGSRMMQRTVNNNNNMYLNSNNACFQNDSLIADYGLTNFDNSEKILGNGSGKRGIEQILGIESEEI